jgi:hypothetical protein
MYITCINSREKFQYQHCIRAKLVLTKNEKFVLQKRL